MVIHATKMCDIWLRPRTTQSTNRLLTGIENAVWQFKNANKNIYDFIIQLQSFKGYSHNLI